MICSLPCSLGCHIGFWLGGFGLGESTKELCSLLNAVTVRNLSFIYIIEFYADIMPTS
jgi:hypothetical protein